MEKNSTTVIILQSLVGQGGRFSVDVRCPFTPKTVTVSNISYTFNMNPTGSEAGISLLSSNMVNTIDNSIGIFYDNMAVSNPITFKCNGPVNGQIEFTYSEPDPDPAEFREGDLAFVLTFED